jgi:16S rRNA (uracil1498-N3)-methyltransferase
MQKFIIPEIKILPSKICITGQDAKHIFKVLRKKKGVNIAITDGKGKDYNSIILNVTPESIEIKIIEKINSITESFIDITLGSGMLKDKKMDFVIKHITQLGVQKWMPFFCERSIPSPNIIKMEKRKKRWESIAKESLKQCNRSCLPEISEPLAFETLMKQSENHDLKIAFWEKSDQRIKTLQNSDSPKKIII